MRLFIAVPLTPAIRRSVEELSPKLRPALASYGGAIRWTPAEQLHITLKFLGEAGEDRLPALAAALDGIGREQSAFSVSLESLGCFPAKGPPAVLWMGVGSGADSLRALARRVDTACHEFGFPLEPRAYHPHVTLGRLKALRGGTRFREQVAQFHVNPVGSLDVETLDLMESRLSASGPTYVRRHQARLLSKS